MRDLLPRLIEVYYLLFFQEVSIGHILLCGKRSYLAARLKMISRGRSPSVYYMFLAETRRKKRDYLFDTFVAEMGNIYFKYRGTLGKKKDELKNSSFSNGRYRTRICDLHDVN